MTTKDLPTASAQSVFDFVVAHLREQNAKSEENGKCLYRHPSGLRCAAGALIADEDYSPEMESRSWLYLVDHNIVPNYHAYLIWYLQATHDNFPPKDWESQFQSLATQFNLKYELVS